MELIKTDVVTKVKKFFGKVADDNLLLYSSSISYYSALALAPFLLILLWVASLLGQNIQSQIVNHASNNFSPQVGEAMEVIFQNINEGLNLSSLSGIVGALVLLSTCSLVFIQFRYAFDIIYGYYNPDFTKSIWQLIRERIVAMIVVLGGAVLLIVSFTLAAIVEYLVASEFNNATLYRALIYCLNFCIYLTLFSGLHYFTPSKRPGKREALKMGGLTSIFFLLGNLMLTSYLKSIASSSVYGAAGTLLVFLVWTYYSAFTIFLSVEVFQFIKKFRRREEIKKGPLKALQHYFFR
jgi:membrane protein